MVCDRAGGCLGADGGKDRADPSGGSTASGGVVELICYVQSGREVDTRPASSQRTWMDDTPEQHAYRCLPLTHANQHGWEIYCPQTFTAWWSGGQLQSDLRFTLFGEATGGPSVISAFGSGINTYQIPCLFKTPPGINLWVMGPPNRIKDGMQPLSGIVETDWLEEHNFTMNWKITRPGMEIVSQKGEPFCFLCPIPQGFVESFSPRMMPLPEAPQIAAAHQQGTIRRRAFQDGLDIRQDGLVMQPGASQGRAWQRRYYRGIDARGEPAFGHQTRLHLRAFTAGEE